MKKKKNTPNRLDLHGIKHEEVRQEVIALIEKYWDTNTELKIITGHSASMKEEVINVVKEYKLSYTIGDCFGLNPAYVEVTFS
jgi:DNA-nicking Smr family endonuclease